MRQRTVLCTPVIGINYWDAVHRGTVPLENFSLADPVSVEQLPKSYGHTVLFLPH